LLTKFAALPPSHFIVVLNRVAPRRPLDLRPFEDEGFLFAGG
jgi:hypothetical protein